mmetsp:Transcript_4961/g.10868  ORF Transcript_4961/g.10868 Transcript_4961/m.10868 type:complete len:332 (+) Transcript_4961:85-1080(+)
MLLFATACLASCRPRFLFAGIRMASPSSAAANAAASRIRQLSSSSVIHSSFSSDNESTGSYSTTATPLLPPKRVLLLRHGQAVHNPRAEAARENGCSFDTFLQLMAEDDQFDSALTELGENQAMEAGRQEHIRHALRNVEMVVSSPLSRALRTADLVHPPPYSDTITKPSSIDSLSPRRKCIEDFREINGKLLNAKRRPRFDLEGNFPHWCFKQIPEHDESWTDELESIDDCSERGYRGLLWTLQQREDNVLVVCHGGLLSYTLNNNSKVVLIDGRKGPGEEEQRCITKRFGNCEMREFIMTAWEPDEQNNGDGDVQPVITLEEIAMEMKI